jgi:transcriptional repressor NrdR
MGGCGNFLADPRARRRCGIADFTPSVTGREWGKTGVRTAGGVSAPFCALIRALPGAFLSTGNGCSFGLPGCFNCYNFCIGQDQRNPPFHCASFAVAHRSYKVIADWPTSAMKCPFCGFANDKVVDSRESKEAESIRRRRECLKCGKRFTTYERIDEIPYMVVKKDGRREKFDRQKVLNGLLRACEKRPVPISKLEQIVNEAESFVIESPERERKTSELGELIMNRLRRYDKVAYVRFASVYLDFKDVKEFMNELKDLVKVKTPGVG